MADLFVFTTPRPWDTEQGVMPSPEELGAYMAACTDEERVEIARRYEEAHTAQHDCFIQNHVHLRDEVVWLRARLVRMSLAWGNARSRARAYRIVRDGFAERLGVDPNE